MSCDAHPGVLGVDPVGRVREQRRLDEAAGGRVAEVDHRAAGRPPRRVGRDRQHRRLRRPGEVARHVEDHVAAGEGEHRDAPGADGDGRVVGHDLPARGGVDGRGGRERGARRGDREVAGVRRLHVGGVRGDERGRRRHAGPSRAPPPRRSTGAAWRSVPDRAGCCRRCGCRRSGRVLRGARTGRRWMRVTTVPSRSRTRRRWHGRRSGRTPGRCGWLRGARWLARPRSGPGRWRWCSR